MAIGKVRAYLRSSVLTSNGFLNFLRICNESCCDISPERCLKNAAKLWTIMDTASKRRCRAQLRIKRKGSRKCRGRSRRKPKRRSGSKKRCSLRKRCGGCRRRNRRSRPRCRPRRRSRKPMRKSYRWSPRRFVNKKRRRCSLSQPNDPRLQSASTNSRCSSRRKEHIHNSKHSCGCSCSCSFHSCACCCCTSHLTSEHDSSASMSDNPFINFLRCYRKKHTKLSQCEMIRRAARRWHCLKPHVKKNFKKIDMQPATQHN